MSDKHARITRRRLGAVPEAKPAREAPPVRTLDAGGVAEMVGRGLWDLLIGDSSPLQKDPAPEAADAIDTEGDEQ